MCLVHCHTFLATWSTCHRLIFLPNFATLVVAILLVTLFVAATLCLSLVMQKLVMNQTGPKTGVEEVLFSCFVGVQLSFVLLLDVPQLKMCRGRFAHFSV